MSIQEVIKKYLRKPETIKEATLITFANLPIYQLIKGKQPFDSWHDPNAKIPPRFEGLFQGSVSMYQMYVFYILAASKFGNETADKIISIQEDKWNSHNGNFGNHWKNTISRIHSTIAREATTPTIIQDNGSDVTVPFEYALAIDFLTRGSDAPFHSSLEKIKSNEPLPEMNNVDWMLAMCLEYGKNAARLYFEPLFENIKVIM